jgi:hypothetical protein
MKINSYNTKISRKIFNVAAITASCIIPAGYMTKFHIDMFKKDDKSNRTMMQNKMLGFFAGLALSIMLIHRNKKNGILIRASKILLAGVAPFAGLEIAKKINRKLYPDKFKSV